MQWSTGAAGCFLRGSGAPRRPHGGSVSALQRRRPSGDPTQRRRRRQNATHKSEMRQRVFTGIVTQLQDHHGMVDQEVRFPISVVVGRVPLVGEKVLVKAVQDPLQPVNWTAQRVQALNGQPFKSPPPLLPSMSANMKPGILGNKPQPLLKSPKIPPLIPTMQPNPGGMHQMPHHQQMPWAGPFDSWGGNRKRHIEVVGGRRGGRWEEGGSSWGGDGTHQKRRRWRAPEEDAPKRSTSIASPSIPLFSCFPRDSQSLDNMELLRRYPQLHAPSSLFHVQLCWPESFPPSQPLPLAGPCFFHVGPSQPQTETDASESTDTTDSNFSVKVMLLSMPGIEDFYSQCCSCSEDGQAQGDNVHPSTLFKFLLSEKGGEMQLPGGQWCPKIDGSNPVKDSSVLIRTAIRCVKEQTALDLTSCTQWRKMAELRLLTGDKAETVVIFLPDVWNLVPTAEEWAQSRDEQKEDESPLPEAPSLVVQPSAGLTLSTLSLSSILERTKDAFEVCLVGELFSEMLQRDFGMQLYHSLRSLPPDSNAPVSKVKAEDNTFLEEGKKTVEKKAKTKGASDSKKKKTKEAVIEEEDTVMKDEEDEPENQEEGKEQAVGEEELNSGISDNQSPKDNDEPLDQCIELPRKVLLSWVFFDRHLTGRLREKDVQNILLSLGLYLTNAQALDLVKKASVGGQCLYHKLCSRWTDSEEVPYDLSAEGNKGLLPALPSKERGSSRRSTNSANSDIVTYKGTIVNIPNLLQALESSKAVQHELERRLTSVQATLEEIEAKQELYQQEQLKSKLEKSEEFNKVYEKSLKENAGHMLDIIEKMQKMVDQTTVLTRTKETKGTKD